MAIIFKVIILFWLNTFGSKTAWIVVNMKVIRHYLRYLSIV